jgi:hypothetical protein
MHKGNKKCILNDGLEVYLEDPNTGQRIIEIHLNPLKWKLI